MITQKIDVFLKRGEDVVDLPYQVDVDPEVGGFAGLDPEAGLIWLRNRKALATRQRIQAALEDTTNPAEQKVYEDLLAMAKDHPVHVWGVVNWYNVK